MGGCLDKFIYKPETGVFPLVQQELDKGSLVGCLCPEGNKRLINKSGECVDKDGKGRAYYNDKSYRKPYKDFVVFDNIGEMIGWINS